MVYFPTSSISQQVIINDPLKNKVQDSKIVNTEIKTENPKPIETKVPDTEKYQKLVQSVAKEQVASKDFKTLLSGLISSAEKSGIEPEELIANKEVIRKFLPSVGDYLDKVEQEYNNNNKGKSNDSKIDLDFKNGELRFHTDNGVKVATYENGNLKLDNTKYQKFASEISKQKLDLNDFDGSNLLKNVFIIAEANGLKAEDILGLRKDISKIFPKLSQSLEKANASYEELNKNVKPEDKTQLSFSDGNLVFKTGQDTKILDANGELIADPNNKAQNKTESTVNIKEAKVSSQFTSTDGSSTGGYVDVDDLGFGINNSGKDFSQALDVNLKKGSVSQNVTMGNTSTNFYSDKTGYTKAGITQKGVGSVNISGGANKGTTVAVQSEKLGGIQVSGGENQQTVVDVKTKIKGEDYGAGIRTGNNQGIQVKADLGKSGSFDVKVNSNSVKVGGTLNGTGGSIDVSRANNVVTQSVKNGVFTTQIKDDNQTSLTASYKGSSSIKIGISAKKGHLDSRSHSTSIVDPKFTKIDKLNTELSSLEMEKKKISDQTTAQNIKPEEKTQLEELDKKIGAKKEELKTERETIYPEEKLSRLTEERKKILDIVAVDRTPEQKEKLKSLDKETSATRELIKQEKDNLKPSGNNVQDMTENLMFVQNDKKDVGKKEGWEYAISIPKGDNYNIQKSRELSYGADVSVSKNLAKVSNKGSIDVDINLSIEGLGDSKVKVSVSRNVQKEQDLELESQSNILSAERLIKKQKSQNYEVVIDLKTEEGKKLYSEIMESSSKFCEELPVPEENTGVKIISNKDESAREKEGDKTLKIDGVSQFGISKETESKVKIENNYGQISYDMEGSTTRTTSQSSKKLPVLGKVFSDETKIASGDYSITPSKERQIEILENTKEEIKKDPDLTTEKKSEKLKEIESKISFLEKEIESTQTTVSNLKSKKEELVSFVNSSPQDKDKKINELDKQISDLESVNKPLLEPKEKEISDINSKIDELDKNINISKSDKDKQIGDLNSRKTKLNDEISKITKPAQDIKISKDELVKYDKLLPNEKEKYIASFDAKITEAESTNKTSFKIKIDDSRTTRYEVQRYNRLQNSLTSDTDENIKGKKYNDKSAVSMEIELVADEKDIETILNTSKKDFIKAAIETKDISRSGNGIRRLEHKFEKAEENANKEADAKKYPNPSEERNQLIKASKMDVIMKFVERNGKDGIAVLQKICKGNIQVKSSSVEVSGYKAENIYSNDKIQKNDKKTDKVMEDGEVTGKEARSSRKMRRDTVNNREEAQNKLSKIDKNPLLNTAQKATLKADIQSKIKDLDKLIEKLDNIISIRDKELYPEDPQDLETDFNYDW